MNELMQSQQITFCLAFFFFRTLMFGSPHPARYQSVEVTLCFVSFSLSTIDVYVAGVCLLSKIAPSFAER